ncbi:hypothetical protein M2275_007015 [Rhodococcus opacus]|nr:hypothetical protein [Rhodococcus opacus]
MSAPSSPTIDLADDTGLSLFLIEFLRGTTLIIYTHSDGISATLAKSQVYSHHHPGTFLCPDRRR